MSAPTFGIIVQRSDEEGRPVLGADLSTIGIVGPASGADVDAYPLNTPVKVYSNDTVLVGKLGTSEYIADAIDGINDQLGALQVAAQLVIVRTAVGTNVDPTLRAQETIANMMGSSVSGTGVWALVQAPELLACTPRIILTPGYTGMLATSLDTLTIGVHGAGYVPGTSYPMTFTGGGTDPTIVQATGHAVADANGAISQAQLVIDSYGAWYQSNPTVTLPIPPAEVRATLTTAITLGAVTSLIIGTEGSGYLPGTTYAITFTGGGFTTVATAHAVADSLGRIRQADLHLDTPGAGYTTAPTATVPVPPVAVRATLTALVAAGANPICAELTPILNQLLGHAIIESTGTSEQNDEDWRETLQSERLIALSGGVKIFDTAGDIVVRPMAPRMAGAMVRRDHETGAPFHSVANQPIQGIVGPARAIRFSLVDGATEGQQLLANDIGILVRGEVGSDFAIAAGGFVLISFANLAEDPLWKFYNVTRGWDFIVISLIRAERFYLGRFNITGHTVQALVSTAQQFLRDLTADEHIVGGTAGFRSANNSAEEIRLGHLAITWRAEPPPVLVQIKNLASRYKPSIDAMVQNLERQLNIAA